MIGNVNPPRLIGDNLAKAIAAWGDPLPEWVRMLAAACDRANQRDAGDRIGQSAGTVSRVLRRCYAGDYAEIERKVRAAFSAERVPCPVTGAQIQLKTCMRNRRRYRQGPPREWLHREYDRACPTCPNNTDLED